MSKQRIIQKSPFGGKPKIRLKGKPKYGFVGKEWLRSFSAAGMLLLFTFSITPRKDLHDFLANHRDTPSKAGFPDTKQFNTAGFHCNCETLVVESPFIDETQSFLLQAPASWSCAPAVLVNAIYSSPVLSADLRGPPFA